MTSALGELGRPLAPESSHVHTASGAHLADLPLQYFQTAGTWAPTSHTPSQIKGGCWGGCSLGVRLLHSSRPWQLVPWLCSAGRLGHLHKLPWRLPSRFAAYR
ncbi:hypothetical protein J6590_096589 [Homalodisca vitripennis]|nr:hypothetical protein J6590_096589 [Homalodisca vitripennis]